MADGLRYCPNLACPHRARVEAPAEFLDHVKVCSDCGQVLVDSEEHAIRGTRPEDAGPYRVAARPSDAPRSTLRPGDDTTVGVAAIVVGVALTAGTYALAPSSGGRYVVAWGPIAYGVYRLVTRREHREPPG